MKFLVLLTLMLSLTANAAREIKDLTTIFGTGASSNVKLEVEVGTNPNPALRFDPVALEWQFSNNGTDFSPIGEGSPDLNILLNPNFEKADFDESWTATGTATFSAETSVLIQGKKAFKAVASSQTFSLIQDSTSFAAQLAGMQGFVKVYVWNTNPNARICARAAGVTLSGNNCITPTVDGAYKSYEIPVVLSATSNGIEAFGTSGSGTTIVDVGFVGLISGAMPEVSQAQLAGQAYIAATTSCSWSRTNTALGAFTTTAACPGPTVTKQNIGSWQTTDSDLPRFTVNNLPPGQYVAEFTNHAASAGTTTSSAIFDGSTTCVGKPGNNSGGTVAQVTSCFFEYTSAGNRSFELYAAAASGAYTVSNSQISQPNGMTFRLYYYPPTSKVYSQPNNQDTDWVSCGLTTADFIAWGTVSSIQDLCKKDGSDLLVNLKFTAGTTSGAELRVGLRLLGSSLTSASSTTIPSLRAAGLFINGQATTNNHGGAVLIEPSVTYMTFGDSTTFGSAAGTNPLVKVGATSNLNGSAISINARIPISGWSNSIITGTFANVVTAPGISKPKTCFYYFGGASATLASPTECTTGTCVEVYDSCGAGTPPTVPGTGNFNAITFSNGTWANSTPIDCRCEAFDTTTDTDRECRMTFITGQDSWSTNSSGGYVGKAIVRTAANAAADAYVKVSCMGQAP